MTDLEVHVASHGAVPEASKRYAEEKVRRATRIAPGPILFARVVLTEVENPSVERRVRRAMDWKATHPQ